MAPTLEPTTTSAVAPCATRARSIPTCTAPKLPPPANTKAVFGRLALSGIGGIEGVDSVGMTLRAARHCTLGGRSEREQDPQPSSQDVQSPVSGCAIMAALARPIECILRDGGCVAQVSKP